MSGRVLPSGEPLRRDAVTKCASARRRALRHGDDALSAHLLVDLTSLVSVDDFCSAGSGRIGRLGDGAASDARGGAVPG